MRARDQRFETRQEERGAASRCSSIAHSPRSAARSGGGQAGAGGVVDLERVGNPPGARRNRILRAGHCRGGDRSWSADESLERLFMQVWRTSVLRGCQASGGPKMPYSQARYLMLMVIGVLIVGFWPSYFAVTTTVPWQFHAHGVAASLWVLTVTAQTWTAHSKRQLPLHRAVGKASLFLFPFLTGGLAAIISRQGMDYVANDPVNLLDGPGFLTGTMVALAAYVVVYYRALKYRRKVWVHAGYMLSTPLILFESPFSRLMGLYIPRFQVHGPADFPHIMQTIVWSCALE